MTDGKVQLRVAGNVTRGYVDQINAIAQDAAQTDNAGKWGIDGWVRLIHNLLDLQMRTCATAVDIALAGPTWWLEQPSTDPGPSDPVTVPCDPDDCSHSKADSLNAPAGPSACRRALWRAAVVGSTSTLTTAGMSVRTSLSRPTPCMKL